MKYIGYKTISIQRLIIYELDLNNFIEKQDTQIEIIFKVASENDLDSLDKEHYHYSDYGRQWLKHQQTKGDRCILAIKKGKIIGYVWIMKGKMELSINNCIKIPQNKVYIYNGFVLNEYRGKRVLNAIDYYIIDILINEGKKFILTTVATNNKPSIHARKRIGFKKIGNITQFRFFGLNYDYISKKDFKYLQKP
jgi:L-amino acid N-acyltransferase YncA